MDAFDLHTTHLHLGRPSSATVLPDFSWDPAALARYEERFADDGAEGRLVAAFHQEGSWEVWEAHPAGDEVVVLLSGRAELLQEVGGEVRRVALAPGHAVVNPPGVWHTMDVHEPGDLLTITPGLGTEHRPR